MRRVDAVIIGGGFFGCMIALKLKALGFRDVVLAERERRLMSRASYVNQARVHNGYHYPRSLPTALRSRENFARFCDEFSHAVDRGLMKYYAIASASRVTPDQFERFCERIGASCQPAWSAVGDRFDSTRVRDVFRVEERSFNAVALAKGIAVDLRRAGVSVLTSTPARVERRDPESIVLALGNDRISASYVFNATYAALDSVGVPIRARLKRELAEIALVDPPAELGGIGITVMDGPFFSVMPFPAAGCFSLSHVRYTPHAYWHGNGGEQQDVRHSHAQQMIRDASLYMPSLARARHLRSIYEIKTVLERNEDDDGRPVLYEIDDRFISVLGGKVDNIYDVLQTIEATTWKL